LVAWFTSCTADEDGPPRLVWSSPRLDESAVYPAVVEGGTGELVRLQLTFSRAMDPNWSVPPLAEEAGPDRSLVATWDRDDTTLVLVVRAPPFSGSPPLADLTTYTLDLRGLVDTRGTPLDPHGNLHEGRLVFSTGVRDPLLNHSCGHVNLGPFAEAEATPSPTPQSPRSDAAHHRYTVALPKADGGGFGGYTRFLVVGNGRIHLFLDRTLSLSLLDHEGHETPLPLSPTPAACDGISHVATFAARRDDQLFLRFSAREAEARMIVETELE
jgi:hypothetical protein